MLERILEPEVMDSAEEARDYDAMDHAQVNGVFVDDFLDAWPTSAGAVIDVGTGTAQIPIELCRRHAVVSVLGIDLAEHMLRLGVENIRRASLSDRIRLERIDAKTLPFPDGSFAAVISNSIVHHIPKPLAALREMVRVTAPGGIVFVRDLLRPADDDTVNMLVNTYAGDANAHQRQLFEASLRAALSLREIRGLVSELGFSPDTVTQTTDRHWTWRTGKCVSS